MLKISCFCLVMGGTWLQARGWASRTALYFTLAKPGLSRGLLFCSVFSARRKRNGAPTGPLASLLIPVLQKENTPASRPLLSP